MRNAAGKGSGSLMGEYSALLSDAILRRRTWVAEQTAHVEHELASSAKSEFAVEMNHMLSAPLKTIVDLAGLLGEQEERRLKDVKIVEYADLIRAAGTHLLTTINEILDISKMQRSKNSVDGGSPEVSCANAQAGQVSIAPPCSALPALNGAACRLG